MQMPQSTSEALTVLSDVLSSGNLSANRTSPYRHLYTSEGCVSEGCGLWAWVMGWWLDLDDLSFQLFQLLWLWFYDSTSQTPSTFLIPQILGCIRKLSAHVKPLFKSHSLVGLGSLWKHEPSGLASIHIHKQGLGELNYQFSPGSLGIEVYLNNLLGSTGDLWSLDSLCAQWPLITYIYFFFFIL